MANFEGQLFCVDLQTQKIVWTYDNPEESFFAIPAVCPKHLFVGSRENKLICLDSLSGHEQWTFPTEDAVNSNPVICGMKVIFGCDDGFLRILNLGGKETWSANLGQPIVSSPAIADNFVLVGCDDGVVYAFSAVK